MTETDLRLLCTALGFTAVVMQGEKLLKDESASRAVGLAKLIEEFCHASVPEAFGRADTDSETRLPIAERMANVIVAIRPELTKRAFL